MKRIAANDSRLVYCGRIDYLEETKPLMIYSASFVRIRFSGARLAVVLKNKHVYWENRMGLIVDGVQSSFLLDESDEEKEYVLFDKSANDRDNAEDVHDILLFKRMDSCHSVRVCEFITDDEGTLLQAEPLSERKIEVYGDSVSCGEVAEAVWRVGQVDPEHKGEYSNSYCSYAWIAARSLNATLHNVSQGGIALRDHTGWFLEPDYPGVESCYNKLNYNYNLGPLTEWDFSQYTPNIVIFAFGQNDNHPVDYMADDYEGAEGQKWRATYKELLEKLMKIYPKATFILTTTILQHHPNWDRAIEEVTELVNEGVEAENKRVYHFLYTRNGSGTPGHIRTPEAEEMARELVAYIDGLGSKVWEN